MLCNILLWTLQCTYRKSIFTYIKDALKSSILQLSIDNYTQYFSLVSEIFTIANHSKTSLNLKFCFIKMAHLAFYI